MAMKNLNILSGNLNHVINVSGSKSYGNRALIRASLLPKTVVISNLPDAQDFWDLVEILKNLGVEIQHLGDKIQIDGTNLFSGKLTKFNLGEGGTTARFVLALLALDSKEYEIDIHDNLKKRPFDELLKILELLGAKISKKTFPLKIQGPLRANHTIEVDAKETSQFVSALKLVADKINLEIKIKNLLTSANYVAMSQQVIKEIKITNEYQLPIDFSGASYFIFYALLNQNLAIKNCYQWDDLQGECELIKSLPHIFSPHLMIKQSNIKKNFNFDVKNCLDIVPPLFFYLCYVDGVHEISNIKNLKHKESNRIEELSKLAKLFNKKIEIHENVIRIWGTTEKLSQKVVIQCPDDHRIIMTSYLFLKHNAGGELRNIEPVKKSFSKFFEISEI
jgi:3-phosphoshikimate 1-carboxyvinyltransferase